MDMTPDPAWMGVKRLLPAWEALAADCAEANCFYAPEMLLPALRHLARGEDVRLIEAWDGARLIGLLPVARAQRHGRLPIANMVNWMHRHCFFGAPLIRRGGEGEAWERLLDALDAAPFAPGFLHLSGLDDDGPVLAALRAVCARQRRGLTRIHAHERALLRSDLSADAYWETHVRAKKRKELRRLQKRLAELGAVTSRELADATDLPGWCEEFLTLERRGWKGAQGTAMACDPAEAAFFRESLAAAFAAERLSFLRIDLDGRPIAMLVNFLMGGGGFSFKIAFDEDLARFSPGVLIEIDNLRRVLDGEGIAWMDSCAAPDHPMIDSLWAQRRTIVQYRVALRGPGRRMAWMLARGTDRAAHMLRPKIVRRPLP